MRISLENVSNPYASVKCAFCGNEKSYPINVKSLDVEATGAWRRIWDMGGAMLWCGVCDPRGDL